MQLNSFEADLPVPALVSQEGGAETCRAVFIRAPAIVGVGASVEVLAEYPLSSSQTVDASQQVGASSKLQFPSNSQVFFALGLTESYAAENQKTCTAFLVFCGIIFYSAFQSFQAFSSLFCVLLSF